MAIPINPILLSMPSPVLLLISLASWPQPFQSLRRLTPKLIPHNPKPTPKGIKSPNFSARGRLMREAMNAEDLPDNKPRARDIPRFLVGERRERRVSCKTERGYWPKPNMKSPKAWEMLTNHSGMNVSWRVKREGLGNQGVLRRTDHDEQVWKDDT